MCFIHPSHEEPFGLSIVEAMAMAMPVVACDSGGVPEIVTDGRDGLLVPPRSASALSQAMARLRTVPDKGATLGRAARSTVCARFTPAQAVDAAVVVWGRLCRNAGAGVPENA